MGNLFYNAPKYREGFGITRAVLFYFHRIALVKEQFVILVRKSDEYIFPRICRKNVVKSRKSSEKENVTPCTARE